MSALSIYQTSYRAGVKELLDNIDSGVLDIEDFEAVLPMLDRFKDDEEYVGFGQAQFKIIKNYIDGLLPRHETEVDLQWLYISDESYLRVLGKSQVYATLYYHEQLNKLDEED